MPSPREGDPSGKLNERTHNIMQSIEVTVGTCLVFGMLSAFMRDEKEDPNRNLQEGRIMAGLVKVCTVHVIVVIYAEKSTDSAVSTQCLFRSVGV